MTNKTDLINLTSIKDELINFIRIKLQSLDTKTRTTETSQTFSGDDVETKFTVTNSTTMRYVKTVTIGGVPQTFGTDYTFTFFGPDRGADAGKVVFTTAPVTGTDNISITYGYGATLAYPDYPRVDLGIDQYPRVSLSVFRTSVPGGMQGSNNVNKSIVRISILFMSEKTNVLDTIEFTLNQAIMQNAKSFYNFGYIHHENTRDINLTEDRTGDVLARNMDFIIPNRFEIVNYV